MKFKVLPLYALLFAVVMTVNGQTPVQNASADSKAPANYLLGPGDVVEGKVLGEEDFTFKATVDEDGNIEVPFFDQPIMAKCRSERELRADVTKLLAKYLRNPLVSVNITGRNSRPPATIYGEFARRSKSICAVNPHCLKFFRFPAA